MKPAKLLPFVGHIVRMAWKDACGNADWQSEQEAIATRLTEAQSVGWVLVVTDELVTLAADRDDDGNVANTTTVPCGWVQSVDRLG